jgi:limonene-1,2-epoxide hydrolase
MSDPVRVVTEFIDTINASPDGFEKAVRGWFTPQTIWENVGMATTTGPDQAMGLMQNMAASGISGLRIENVSVAAAGSKVLTERIDYMLDASGATKLALRCMGVFEVDATGKFVRWSDYFDTSVFKPST